LRNLFLPKEDVVLQDIMPTLRHNAEIVSAVSEMDIEIADASLVRIAGTGIFSTKTDESAKPLETFYIRVRQSRSSLLFDDSPADFGRACGVCAEAGLAICAPIICAEELVGYIGMAGFSSEHRQKVLQQKDMYIRFAEQFAENISRLLSDAGQRGKNIRMLDMLLEVTESDSHAILVCDTEQCISYANEAAVQLFSLPENHMGTAVSIKKTGNRVSDMDEFEVRLGDSAHLTLGKHMSLEGADDSFASVLLADTMPAFAQMLSGLEAGARNLGGLGAIVGESPRILGLKTKVLQVARTTSTVLITGASGTGKEMFARAIHAESARRSEAFVAVNCAAIPESLLESEFFGYAGGAFTGANRTGRIGKFEMAHKGVLFLDEIGSMPLFLQAKLLRVLQEKRFTRLGSNREIDVDVRIIAATNENLQDLVSQRLFRSDLFYRLNVVPLQLPSLAERSEDIHLLARYFVERCCRRFGKEPMGLSNGLVDALQRYAWPGNIRELENCMEYMINIHESGCLRQALLPEKIRTWLAEQGGVHGDSKARCILPAQPGAIVPLQELESTAIQVALHHFGESTDGKRKAADALGISTATLYRKLKA
jgi:transcriptional regulator with PAS, ATPase and Fis domain